MTDQPIQPNRGTPSAATSSSYAWGSQVAPATVVVVMLTTLVILASLLLLWQLREIIGWFVVATFLAVSLNPLVNRVQQRVTGRVAAILLVYAALLLALIGLGMVVLPPIIDQVQSVIEFAVQLSRQPAEAEHLILEAAQRFGLGGLLQPLAPQLRDLSQQFGGVARAFLSFGSGIFSGVTALISILVITFFLLLDGARLVESSMLLLPEPRQSTIRRLLTQFAAAIYGYIVGNISISIICGTCSYLALRLLGMPYAAALSLIVALLDLIPQVGATLGGILMITVALFVDPIKAIILLIYFILYQQVENNILQPLVYSRAVRLHPLAIFFAVLAGGEFLGILGALLAIPFAEMIRIVLYDWLDSRRRVQASPPA